MRYLILLFSLLALTACDINQTRSIPQSVQADSLNEEWAVEWWLPRHEQKLVDKTEQPVDLICVLLAPESAGADHLKALARVSRLLRDSATCEKIRGSDTRDAIFALMTESATSHAA